MAPKRKRTDDPAPATATRTTRSSARGKAATTTGAAQADASASVDATDTTTTQGSQAKKAKQTTAKATTNGNRIVATATRSISIPSKRGQRDRAKGGNHNSADGEAAPQAAPPNASNTSLASTAKDKAAKPATEPQPYTVNQADALFSKYADEDDSTVIGPEGLEQLCSDGEIPLDSALPLILAWQFGASEVARITKEEWVKGTSELQIAHLPTLKAALRELEDLLVLDGSPLTSPTFPPAKKKPTPEPYNRTRYYQYAADKAKSFNDLYTFCFTLAKPPQSRNIDMETAAAFWSVLVVPKYPMMKEFLQFISEKGTYKGVNKDIWGMALEFFRTISPTLDNYEDESAWPTIFDEFVSWKRSHEAPQ